MATDNLKKNKILNGNIINYNTRKSVVIVILLNVNSSLLIIIQAFLYKSSAIGGTECQLSETNRKMLISLKPED
jgi:hypothetical protein